MVLEDAEMAHDDWELIPRDALSTLTVAELDARIAHAQAIFTKRALAQCPWATVQHALAWVPIYLRFREHAAARELPE
jgi:uncharacterized small protein (DUF1192 family)